MGVPVVFTRPPPVAASASASFAVAVAVVVGVAEKTVAKAEQYPSASNRASSLEKVTHWSQSVTCTGTIPPPGLTVVLHICVVTGE